MIGLALKLLKHRATWWAAAGIAVLSVGWGYGATRHRAGRAEEKAVWVAEAALARESAAAVKRTADSAMAALSDSLRVERAMTAELREKLALSRGQYREALGWYKAAVAARDTTVPLTPEQRACDEVVSSCTLALAAEEATRASLTTQLRTAEALVAVQAQTIRTEPERTTLSNREAMARQRAAFKAPSRTRWMAVGVALGVAGAYLATR